LEDAITVARGHRRRELKEQRDARFPDGFPRIQRPHITTWRGYTLKTKLDEEERIIPGPFDPDFVVLTKFNGNALGIESTLQLTGALRNAAMKAAGDNPPEWLTGHTLEGKPSWRRTLRSSLFHMLALSTPMARHGVGTCRTPGLGTDDEVRRVLGALLFRKETGEPADIHLWRTGVWDWMLERETRERPPQSLRRDHWNGPSRIWGSVTPIVLHHYPKRSRAGHVEQIVSEAFASALLPPPEQIQIQSVSAHSGAGHVRGVPSTKKVDRTSAATRSMPSCVSPTPSKAPVLVGRGRFRGYGLLAPIHEGPAAK